jgi:predicted regulator of Ras-like GTPase activity (Roadblock/LC7/MglB family)
MPNLFKTKIAGVFKGLLRRLEGGVAQFPSVPGKKREGAQTQAVGGPLRPPPLPTTNAPAASSPFKQVIRPTPTAAPGVNQLSLPIQCIVGSLPAELRAKLAQTVPADSAITLSTDKVVKQLGSGSVKVTFGELRAAAPEAFLNSGSENDSKAISLPLNEIIARLDPSQLPRRSRRKLEVSEEIAGPFGAKGKGVSVTHTTRASTPLPRSVEPAAPAAAPVTPVAPPPPNFVNRTDPRPPIPAALAPRTAAPAARRTVPAAPAKAAPSAPPVVPAQPAAPTHMAPVEPATPSAAVPMNAAPAKAGQDGFNSAPQIPVDRPVERPAEQPIMVSVVALAENWPDGVKQEIVSANLNNSQLALPATLIEPGLKRGRIVIAWKNLRIMIRPTPPPVSPNDGVELELPLKIIAPLFFATQKVASKNHSKLAVSADIPNLFNSNKQPEAPAPAPMAPPPAQKVEQKAAAQPWGDLISGTSTKTGSAGVVAPAPAKAEDTNYYSKPEVIETSGEAANPKEIVARALALPGVAGAVVALPDGLSVASQVPPDLNADTLAAFLPQIFSRTGQSTNELRMGDLNNLSFTAGNVPWKIFRVNAVYFAAFGRAGQALPTAQLAALAVQLDRKK